MFGDKDLKVDSDDHLSMKYNGTPAYATYWMFGANSSNSALPANIRGSIEVTYYIKFYEKKNTFNYSIPV